jgi:hypothetical protein
MAFPCPPCLPFPWLGARLRDRKKNRGSWAAPAQDPIYLGIQGQEVDGPPPVGVLEFEKLRPAFV